MPFRQIPRSILSLYLFSTQNQSFKGEKTMKTFTSLFMVLLLLSSFYIGCKEDTNPIQPPPGSSLDFTITYTISGDTCWFYFSPNEDVRLDSFKTEYLAQNFSKVYRSPDPELRLVKGTVYLFFGWVGNMPRPAGWKFTFWGRKYADNSNYTVTKNFTVP